MLPVSGPRFLRSSGKSVAETGPSTKTRFLPQTQHIQRPRPNLPKKGRSAPAHTSKSRKDPLALGKELPPLYRTVGAFRLKRRPYGTLLLKTHQLPFQRFHVLFNSLFKVLCIFPSRYLCAIGLVSVFSFRWSIPPTLHCTLKQCDSTRGHH